MNQSHQLSKKQNRTSKSHGAAPVQSFCANMAVSMDTAPAVVSVFVISLFRIMGRLHLMVQPVQYPIRCICS